MAHTVDSLLAIWTSLVDELFSQPFIEAGEGGGLEVWTQAMAQLARVSTAIESTAASLYLQPYSGQVKESAMGPRHARVELQLRRTSEFQFSLYFGREFTVEEATVQPSLTGGVVVHTGRRYSLLDGIALFAGNAGPVYSIAQAESVGSGYNEPRPGELTAIVQPALDARGEGATVVSSAGMGDWLYAANAQGSFIESHVGQYVQILTGANAGKLRRVIGYRSPDTTPIDHGGAVTLSPDVVLNIENVVGEFESGALVEWPLGKGRVLACNGTCLMVQRESGYFSPSGTISTGMATADITGVHTGGMLTAIAIDIALIPPAWFPGDVITQANTLAEGLFVAQENEWVLIAPTKGTFNNVDVLTGSLSAYVGLPDGLVDIAYDPRLVPEVATVEWKVVDWADEFGVVVTNEASPAGGRFGVLDELMRDRGVVRGVGESDAALVKRGTMPADVVSPNAIRRAIARHYGTTDWEFREVGTRDFPGFFYDVPTSEAGLTGFACAYDMTTVDSRFALQLGYEEFRAFFLIGLPNLGLGEFGFAYDDGQANAWDVGFLDGYAVEECRLRQRLWDDIVGRKAGGVGFDFYIKW